MLNRYKRITAQFLLVMMIYQMIRILFLAINRDLFSGLSVDELGGILVHSLRFDLSSFFALNVVYLFFILMPLGFLSKEWIQRMLRWLFVLTNVVSFLFDLSDIAYFPYTRKRMTADVFHLIGKKSDFIDLLPSYILRFWPVTLMILLFIILFIVINRKIEKRTPFAKANTQPWLQLPIYLMVLGLSIIAIRGGLQLKPIIINNALLVAQNKFAPLVYNTPFSILHSFEERQLYPLNEFSHHQLEQDWPYKKNYRSSSPFTPKNVVVIILESFGKQYTGSGGRKSYTPFLDSLSHQGLLLTKAFANASTSATGIPAVLAGIPNFYNEAFTTSPYGRNKIDAIGSLLKPLGYATSFYHGGVNGTMNFNVFASNAGFDRYYGKNEYPNPSDYDGTWGIRDDAYLRYFAHQLNQEKQPFASALFTLSSHEPFALPAQHPPFLDSLHDIQRGIAYTDYSLREFFALASKMPWYKNTLFVFSADHNYMAGSDEQHYYDHGLGIFSIPILLYAPSNPNLKGQNHDYHQQIDILPSVMDYLHYPYPFFALGSSVFRHEPHFVYNHSNKENLFYLNDTLLVCQDTVLYRAYDLSKDSSLSTSISIYNNSVYPKFKSFLQLLHQSLIQNTMSLNKK